MTASRSLWEELLVGGVSPDDEQVSSALEECGRLLLGLHERPAPPEVVAPPGALDRLQGWLRNRASLSSRATEVREVIRRRLGGRGWRELDEWVSALGRPDCLVHGWFGLGQVGLARGEVIEACVGDDAGLADPALDVGFLWGQLAELETFQRPRPSDATLDGLRSAMLRGYGCQPRFFDRGAAVQIALHIHDFSRYHVVMDQELPSWADLLCRLVEEGR